MAPGHVPVSPPAYPPTHPHRLAAKVFYEGVGDDDQGVTRRAHPQTKVGVFVIEKDVFIKAPDAFPSGHAAQPYGPGDVPGTKIPLKGFVCAAVGALVRTHQVKLRQAFRAFQDRRD
jgi:hypothetical protein